MFCPKCDREFPNGIVECPDCELTLTEEPPYEDLDAASDSGTDSLLSLSRIRERTRTRARRNWLVRLALSRPTRLKAAVFAALAILAAALSLQDLFTTPGENTAAGGLIGAIILAAIAVHIWRRTSEQTQPFAPLPRAIHCPACAETILLSNTERQTMAFKCSACGEDFEVVDDSAPEHGMSPEHLGK